MSKNSVRTLSFVLFLLSFPACSSKKLLSSRTLANSEELAARLTPSDEVENMDAANSKANKNALVTSITINLDQVARELGVSKEQISVQAEILSAFMKSGVVARNYCNDETDPRVESVCSLMDTVHDSNPAAWVDKSSSRGRRVRIRPQNFRSQQKMGFGRLLRSVSREPASRILRYVPRLVASTSCPRNLSAAALRKLEALLPSERAKSAMEKLYQHADKCLGPDDEGYEITHLRQALLRYSWGQKKRARLSIRKAMKAKNSSERSRVLYWAGRLETDVGRKNKIWEQLVEQYPLSFHSLEVWREKQLDPFEFYYHRPSLGLERIVADKKGEANEATRWLEALYISGHVESAQRLARWIIRTFKSDLNAANILYISSLKSSHGTGLNALTFFNWQVNENEVILNGQTLRMLFPRPYWEIFDKAAKQTDTYLVLSIARQESGFDPEARSRANARGLLQLLPSTARVLSGRKNNDLYDEELNAELGSKFIGQLIDRFKGSVELALAGYNAGPGRIAPWKERYPTDDRLLFIDLIPFKETRNYVSNIFRNNYWYTRLYEEKVADTADLTRTPASTKQRSDYVATLVSDHRAFGELMRAGRLKDAVAKNSELISENRSEDASDASEQPAGELSGEDASDASEQPAGELRVEDTTDSAD